MRVRLLLGLGVALALGAFVLDMSRSAPRGAGSDHVAPVAFVAIAPARTSICQPFVYLTPEAHRVQLTLGTYGRPVPPLRVTFLDAAGRTVASGSLAGGGPEGLVTVPLRQVPRTGEAARVCVRSAGTGRIALAGEPEPPNPGSALVAGQPAAGRVSLTYLRGGLENWWQLLPTLSRRFGLGKWSLFGTWTLPVVALLLVLVWGATVRLLARELR